MPVRRANSPIGYISGDVTEGAELCRGKKVFDRGVLHQEVRNSEYRDILEDVIRRA